MKACDLLQVLESLNPKPSKGIALIIHQEDNKMINIPTEFKSKWNNSEKRLVITIKYNKKNPIIHFYIQSFINSNPNYGAVTTTLNQLTDNKLKKQLLNIWPENEVLRVMRNLQLNKLIHN